MGESVRNPCRFCAILQEVSRLNKSKRKDEFGTWLYAECQISLNIKTYRTNDTSAPLLVEETKNSDFPLSFCPACGKELIFKE